MRSIFLVFLIITCLFLATGWQSSGGRIGGLRVFNGAPTGTCASNQMAVDSTTGNFYSCKTGGWNQVTGGGGPHRLCEYSCLSKGHDHCE